MRSGTKGGLVGSFCRRKHRRHRDFYAGKLVIPLAGGKDRWPQWGGPGGRDLLVGGVMTPGSLRAFMGKVRPQFRTDGWLPHLRQQ